MVSLSALVLATMSAACAGPLDHTAGPVIAFEAAAEDGRLTRVTELEVPDNAEISLRPLWWLGELHAAADERVGVQIVARASRVDGSTLTWSLTPPRPLGRRRADGRYGEAFDDPATASVRARHIEAIDIFVAQHDGAVEGRGAAAVAEAPEQGPVRADLLARLEQANGGGVLELALRLRLRHGASTEPGIDLRRLVLVEGEPDLAAGATAADGNRSASAASLIRIWQDGGSPASGADGEPLTRVSALMLLLKVEVTDRTTPPEPKQGPGRHRDRDDERLRKAPPRVLASFR